MVSQLSKKAALPLAKILATCRNSASNTGPWTGSEDLSPQMTSLVYCTLIMLEYGCFCGWNVAYLPVTESKKVLSCLIYMAYCRQTDLQENNISLQFSEVFGWNLWNRFRELAEQRGFLWHYSPDIPCSFLADTRVTEKHRTSKPNV